MEKKNILFYIDSHCHLQDYSENDLKLILDSCQNSNINLLYTNATNKDDFQKNLLISQTYSSDKIKIISGFGYHPWFLDYSINNEK
jgi:Tat protein secretion system quality control protein TatD with DNase activity